MTIEEKLKKDEFGRYIHAEGYTSVEQFKDEVKKSRALYLKKYNYSKKW